MIHVCYGFNDNDGRYAKFCGTSILSMFENTSERITVHILHDDSLTVDNRDKFMYIAGQYNQTIKFYNVNVCAPERLNQLQRFLAMKFTKIYVIGMFYRLLLPDIIAPEIDKIIYLDAGDTIVHMDIKNIWNVELEDHPLAAAADSDRIKHVPLERNLCEDGYVEHGKYFNSGVLLINLNHWRANIDKIFDPNRGG